MRSAACSVAGPPDGARAAPKARTYASSRAAFGPFAMNLAIGAALVVLVGTVFEKLEAFA
ncbi:hypothetical protein XH92_37420 [Bradyrhizobium sp. CCBAU 53421]|nr:hypothetical protein XH92_37420 [Bradyrhizobium sp. CCBAU 53421]